MLSIGYSWKREGARASMLRVVVNLWSCVEAGCGGRDGGVTGEPQDERGLIGESGRI